MDMIEEKQSRNMNIPSASDTSEEYSPDRRNLDFSKVKVGLKTLEDAVLTNSGDLKKVNSKCANKEAVLKAIDSYDYPLMREISDFFYKTNGIYSRLCKYAANLYRYDWMVTPYINEGKVNNDKVFLVIGKDIS